MADKDKEYNRTVCGFCPGKLRCEQLGSLLCDDREAWVAADLPCKCMLTDQVLQSPPDEVPIISGNTDPTDISSDMYVDCPRCRHRDALVTFDYQWTPGKPLVSSRTLRCRCCGLDQTHTVT